MAALSITPANVRSYGLITAGVAGGTVTAGMALMLNTSGQLIAAANSTALNAAVVGIAINGASANQPLDYHISGLIDLGATIAIGKVYVLGTAGGIIPVDDVAGGEFITVIGVGTTAARLNYVVNAGGVAAAGAVT